MQKAWDIVKIDGKLNEDNVKAPMREIRRALLEADVSLPVVRGFVKRVQDKALGVKVLFICSPGRPSNCFTDSKQLYHLNPRDICVTSSSTHLIVG